MKFFIDTAEVDEIKEAAKLGLVDGVTTNPSLIKKSGQDMKEVLAEICSIIPKKPVSAEVVATKAVDMLKEAEALVNIAPNIVIKLPMTEDGLEACNHLSKGSIMTNVTLCFSAAQAILAAKAGATFVSPFVGRLDDIGQEGMQLINEISEIYRVQNFETSVLVASVRNPIHVVHAARLGADIATVPLSVIKQMFKHPLTDKGLDAFLKDWKETGQSI